MIFEWMEDSLMLYDEIHEVARNSELNRRQREHSFTYWRKSTTFHPLEVQLCDREFNYESNDRWRDFQFITVCEIRRKQVCISLDDDQYAILTNTAYWLSQYAVLTPESSRSRIWRPQYTILTNTPYWLSQYAGLTPEWPRSRIFRPKRVPYSKVSSIRRIDLPIRRIDPNSSQYIKKSPQTIWGMLLTTKVDPRS